MLRDKHLVTVRYTPSMVYKGPPFAFLALDELKEKIWDILGMVARWQ